MPYAESVKTRWGYWDAGSGCYIVEDVEGPLWEMASSNPFSRRYPQRMTSIIQNDDTRCKFCNTLVFEGERRCVACGAPL